jgi:hypothetical protein
MAGSFEQTKEDLQRTVREIARVLSYRRWSFLIPFCVAATAVFISSHNMPRVYKAYTIFERRNPLPLTKVIQKTGPDSMQGFRREMSSDMLGEEAMLRLADDLQLTKDLPRTPKGHLTDQGKAMRKARARSLRGALSFRQMAAEADRDRVRIEATGSNPEMVVKMTSEVRDNYFEISKTRFLGMLADARAFYNSEIEDTLQRIEAHEAEMDELQEAYPWANPDRRDSSRGRILADQIRIESVEETISSLKREIALADERLHSMPVLKLIRPESFSPDVEAFDTEVSVEAERRRLRQRITQIREQMEAMRVRAQMKDAHPKMQLMMREEQYALSSLKELGEREGRPAGGPQNFTEDAGEAAVLMKARQDVEFELTSKRAALVEAERTLGETKSRRAQFETKRDESLAKQGEFRKLAHQLKDVEDNLGELRRQERQLAKVLDVDAKDQGIEFITIEEPRKTRRPVLPKSRTIMLLAFGVGLACGACSVFLREFFDHTFHTGNAVNFSLGLQILEGIDEILLPADRRRNLLKQLTAVPLACLFLAALAGSGAMAYLSLEKPEKYKRIVQKAKSAWEDITLSG